METRKLSWPMRLVAHLMLAVCTLGWPATWHMAYAQGLPQLAADSNPTDMSWVVSQLGDNAEQALINKRAARLLRGDGGIEIIRGPKLDQDEEPVRLPRLDKDPDEEQQAKKQASRLQPLTQSELIQGAQLGSDTGQAIMGTVDNMGLDTQRVEPGSNQTGPGRMNVTEMLPGYTAKDAADMMSTGAAVYNDPEKLKGMSEQNKRNLRREGCRKTTFVAMELQNIDLAASSPRHRVLKVEFFDIVKEPIPGTSPVEYQSIMKPTTYKRGKVDMMVAPIGGSATVYWDRVDDTYAIKYTYTPFSVPKQRNYFAYNHWFAFDRGAGLERVNDPGLVNYGSPKDGWKPVASRPIELGVKVAYMSADLYQASTIYTPEVQGQPCPPDPPEQCQVPSIGGDDIRWCPGAYGANIALMYDDQANPDERRVGKNYNDMASNNAARKDYASDPSIRTGVMRGLNAGSSAKAQELAGTCRRDPISRIEIDRGKPYGVEKINLCSETLVNPYPNGCKNIKRSFGLAYVGEHNFATVRAYNKVKVAIIDPMTKEQAKDKDGNLLYTYRKEPANVEGPVRTDFSIMGGATCPAGVGCTTEKPDDPLGTSEGYYVEYTHTPMGGQYKAFAFDGVYVEGGGTGEFTHYGKPEEGWKPTGTAIGNGTLHQLKLIAKVYSIPINTFAGCEKYMKFVADGFCQGGKLTCVDTAPTRTVGGVTFGPQLPNSGIVDLLKMWGTDASAAHDEINNGEGNEPTADGKPVVMLEDKMCWEAEGEKFSSCATMEDDGSLKHFFKNNGEEWATDCHRAPDDEGNPLESSKSCKRAARYDGCDTRFKGVFTDYCYNPTIAYDCGVTVDSKLPIVVEEQGDSCSGVVRCMGTECHRPNLSGNHGESFARAMSGMEALNFMMAEMVCEETGKAPTSPSENCTPVVFGGKPMYCKQPIGRQIGITPDCCKDARKAAKGGPSWMDYMKATQALYQISRNATFQNFLSGFDIYNNTAATFGEIAKPVGDAYTAASSWMTENVIQPFQAGFDNLFSSFFEGFGGQAGAAAAEVGTGAAAKQGMISGVIDQLKTKLMNAAYEVLQQISPELASAVFTNGGTAAVAFTETAKEVLNMINAVFMVYAIARLIGQIVFACKQEEYEWGMNDRWRLCTFVDSCCAKKGLLACIEKRQLYCCYKSIATRVITEQIIKHNLAGNRSYGYRSATNGGKLGKCNINCGGFKPMELASIDWSRVDLTEWTDVMVESGMLHPSDPRQSFGVTTDSVPLTRVVGNVDDEEGHYDQRSAAFKTVEGWKENMPALTSNTETLRTEGIEDCYDPSNNLKMPFTYPGCQRDPVKP